MAAPANDNIANAVVVGIATNGGTYTSATINNAEATTEAGEPSGVTDSNKRSCWWKYTPASAGAMTIDTQLSNGDTQLAVYDGGPDLASLRFLVGNSDDGSNNQPPYTSRLSRTIGAAEVGKPFYIQVGAYQSATMDYVLRVQGPASAGGPLAASLAGSLPALTAAVAGTYAAPPVTSNLAGSLAPITASLTGNLPDAPTTSTLAGVLPGLTGAVAADFRVLVDTATPYANDGYNYGGGVSEVDFDPPIAVSPARIRPAKIRRVHQSIPAPTLVDGRPV